MLALAFALVLGGPPQPTIPDSPIEPHPNQAAPAPRTEGPSPVPPRPAGTIHAHQLEDPGVGLRRYGLVVTVMGAILGGGGVIAAYHNPCGKDGSRGGNCTHDVRNSVALIMGAAGLGCLTAGITSLAIGQSYKRQAKIEAGLALSLAPGAGGVLIQGRF